MIKWDDFLYRFHVFLFIDHARATAKKDPMKEEGRYEMNVCNLIKLRRRDSWPARRKVITLG